MTTTPFYERKSYVLSPSEFEELFKNNEEINKIAEGICPVFHEDWKSNLILEKGKDYQHFRPCKDDDLSKKIIEDFKFRKYNGQFADAKSSDGKSLYKFEVVSGKEVGKLDLIRVPFENLPQNWQKANFDAALFAVALIKKYFSKYDHFSFQSFEALSSDVHEFWVSKNGYPGQKASLMLPYALLPVETFQNNEKDKDRKHIILTTTELTNQSNVLKRNRDIVLRAIETVFVSQSCPTGLKERFMKEIEALKYEIAERNAFDFGMHQMLKSRVKNCLNNAIESKNLKPEGLTLDVFEKVLCVPYYEEWKTFHSAKLLNKNLDVGFDEIVVNNEDFNAKQFVREQVSSILTELAENGEINREFATKSQELFQNEIPVKNKQDFANFKSSVQE